MIVEWSSGVEVGAAVLAIGVFDGLHQGHQYLLGEAVADARRRGVAAWAITFSRDPDELFKPAEQLAKLSSNTERLSRLECSGVDGVLSIPFTKTVAALSAVEFLDKIIASSFAPRAIHVGSDFCFGARASGTVGDLEAWAAGHDCQVNAHRLLCDHGLPVTSTRIRGLLASGQVEDAATLLTRPYAVVATVVEGRHAGRAMGFPTANLVLPPDLARVADGVYATEVQLANGQRYPAATSVGVPATFGDLGSTTEACLLDYPADAAPLYGQTLILTYHRYLRPMQAFASVEALQAAIAANVAQTRELFS